MPKAPADASGGIIRVTHDRTHPFMISARAAAQNAQLSWAARGLLWYLLSKPDDWEVRFTDLLRQGDARPDKLRRLLKELETTGYLRRERTHGPSGRWRWLSTVYEAPYADFPYMVEPDMAAPHMADRQIKESDTQPNNEETKERGAALTPNEEDGPSLTAVLAGLGAQLGDRAWALVQAEAADLCVRRGWTAAELGRALAAGSERSVRLRLRALAGAG